MHPSRPGLGVHRVDHDPTVANTIVLADALSDLRDDERGRARPNDRSLVPTRLFERLEHNILLLRRRDAGNLREGQPAELESFPGEEPREVDLGAHEAPAADEVHARRERVAEVPEVREPKSVDGFMSKRRGGSVRISVADVAAEHCAGHERVAGGANAEA